MEYPQESIRVRVDYYDNLEKDLFRSFPSFEKIEQTAGTEIEIKLTDFLTYYLFKDKRPRMSGYRTFQEISRKVQRALVMLQDRVRFNGSSIDWNEDEIEAQDRETSERIGESIGISVVNHIHGLTMADWTPIPVTNVSKTFDYSYASDLKTVIEIETKGSSVSDNSKKTSAVSSHKSSIKSKKSQKSTQDPLSSAVRYGTIAVVGSEQGSIIQCWLVDPPARVSRDPSVVRLLARMRFLRDWIGLVSPRSELAHALVMRVLDLEAVSDPFELDNVQLRKRDGLKFELNWPPRFFQGHSGFWGASKSLVENYSAGGVALPLTRNSVLFLGIHEELLALAAEQNFREIMSYAREPNVLERTITCNIGRRQAKMLDLDLELDPDFGGLEPENEQLDEAAPGRKPAVALELKSKVHVSREGLVFSILPVASLSVD